MYLIIKFLKVYSEMTYYTSASQRGAEVYLNNLLVVIKKVSFIALCQSHPAVIIEYDRGDCQLELQMIWLTVEYLTCSLQYLGKSRVSKSMYICLIYQSCHVTDPSVTSYVRGGI